MALMRKIREDLDWDKFLVRNENIGRCLAIIRSWTVFFCCFVPIISIDFGSCSVKYDGGINYCYNPIFNLDILILVYLGATLGDSWEVLEE